ncbi:aggregation-promoting factor C-terminal-like domain-containing protein [Streptosporangium sp. NPDC003464]
MPTLRRTGVLLITSALAVSTTATVAQASSASASAAAARQGNRAIAAPMVSARGWAKGQFGCLSRLWTRESNWDHRARNRSSGAYGIPQALPGGKMASAGSDWRTNPKTQIKWGLTYIKKRYGSPCGAWAHFQSRGWY